MRKPTKDEMRQTSFMRGWKAAQKGEVKNNPFDKGLFYDNYEKGYKAGKK